MIERSCMGLGWWKMCLPVVWHIYNVGISCNVEYTHRTYNDRRLVVALVVHFTDCLADLDSNYLSVLLFI